MKIYQFFIGAIGYILLVVSASFLDVPILSLLAIPTFVVSILIYGVFLFSFPQDDTINKKWLANLLIIIGLIGLSIVIAEASTEYASYLVAHSRNVIEKFYPSPWLTVFIILGFDIVASSIIALGARRRTRLESKHVFFLWLSAFLSVPITIVLVKLLELSGVPLSA
ncbi:MAG TPA: hypothetical protein ENG79_09230 [Desulfobacteraceae bacterium]|nr:hypothetical protein [Desulfobacteraceae bacterium]